MDLDLEKEKTKYAHKLELIRILVDRFLFLCVMIVIAYIANVVLGKYKSEQIKQQFLLENKLEAINAIKDAYQKAFSAFYWTTVSDKDKAKPLYSVGEPETEYHQAIGELCIVSNRYNIIMSEYFSDLVEASAVLLEGIYYKDRSNRIEYREFMYHLAECFANQCRIELELPPESQKRQFFPFQKFRFEEMHAHGAEHFLDINFEKWKLWSKK